MASPLKTLGGIILLWLFIHSSGVSSSKNECWSLLCLTDSSLNCTCKQELPNWLLSTICLIPLVIICSCCIRVCVHYYNERDNIRRQGGPSFPSSSQRLLPDRISLQYQLRSPPSYDEAVSKQQRRYRPPLDDPPAYEEIAMHSIAPADGPIFPVCMPNNNNTSNV